MDFTFNDEQQALRDSVRQFLQKEVTPQWIRQRWEKGPEQDAQFWQKAADLGLLAMLAPEHCGGLDLNEEDFVQLALECGRVALPGELINTAMVVVPVLSALAEEHSLCAELLMAVASGEQRVGIAHDINPVVNDADLADWIIIIQAGGLFLAPTKELTMTAYTSVDPSRRLFKLDRPAQSASMICQGKQALELSKATLNRGALGAAAYLLGLAESMVEQAITYSGEREQFNKPVGSFQALKHHLADCAVKIDFARTPTYRAAYTTSKVPTRAGVAVSHAKIAASEAALLSAKKAIQVHGAMGYTWECDLHIAMKSAWAMDKVWGDAGFHKKRVHDWLLSDKSLQGAGNTFGRMENVELMPELLPALTE